MTPLSPLPPFQPGSGALVLAAGWEPGRPPDFPLLSEPHTQGQKQGRGESQPSERLGSGNRRRAPSRLPPSLQLRQATNQGWRLWGRARGRGGALTASAASGLRGADGNLQGGEVRRRRAGEALGAGRPGLSGARRRRWLRGWRARRTDGRGPAPQAGAREAAGGTLGGAGAGPGRPGAGRGGPGPGRPREGGASRRRRGNPGRGREGRGRVQMRSRRKKRWVEMRRGLRQEAEEEEAVVGGRKG